MAKLKERHLQYLNDPIFYNEYLKRLNNNLVYSNNRLDLSTEEHDNANISTLDDNLEALQFLLNTLYEEQEPKLTEDIIIKIADTINKHSMYISNGYRTIGEGVKLQGKYPIESPKNIPEKMKELLEKYYNEWSKLDIFEREALFNIEFLRIHPFEDGNGRTSRLILNYNLLRQGHAPVLIPNSSREDYFDARNRKDVKWIKDLFEKESQKELLILEELISEYESKLSSNNRKK